MSENGCKCSLDWLHLFNHWNYWCLTPFKRKSTVKSFPQRPGCSFLLLLNWIGCICNGLTSLSPIFFLNFFYIFLTRFFFFLVSDHVNCDPSASICSVLLKKRKRKKKIKSITSIGLCFHWIPVIDSFQGGTKELETWYVTLFCVHAWFIS